MKTLILLSLLLSGCTCTYIPHTLVRVSVLQELEFADVTAVTTNTIYHIAGYKSKGDKEQTASIIAGVVSGLKRP